MKKRYIISLSILGLITAAALSILVPYWVAGEPRYGGNYGPDYTRRVTNSYSNFEDFQNAYYKNVSQFPDEKLMIFDTSSFSIENNYYLIGWHECHSVEGLELCSPDDEFHYCKGVTSFVQCFLDTKPYFGDENNMPNDECVLKFHKVDANYSLNSVEWVALDHEQSSEYRSEFSIDYGYYDLVDIATNTILVTLLLSDFLPRERVSVEISEERYNKKLAEYEELRTKIKDLAINAYLEMV